MHPKFLPYSSVMFKPINERISSNPSAQTTSNTNNKPYYYMKNAKFPEKLHRILQFAEQEDKGHIISWLPPNNSSFRVHNKKKFIEIIMPLFFSSSNYKSFQRNLNLWDFHTVSKGPDKGKCSHPLFRKEDPSLCHQMIRRALVTSNTTLPSSIISSRNSSNGSLDARVSKPQEDQDSKLRKTPMQAKTSFNKEGSGLQSSQRVARTSSESEPLTGAIGSRFSSRVSAFSYGTSQSAVDSSSDDLEREIIIMDAVMRYLEQRKV